MDYYNRFSISCKDEHALKSIVKKTTDEGEFVLYRYRLPPKDLLIEENDFVLELARLPDTSETIKSFLKSDFLNDFPLVESYIRKLLKASKIANESVLEDILEHVEHKSLKLREKYLSNEAEYGVISYREYALICYGCLPYLKHSRVSVKGTSYQGRFISTGGPPLLFFCMLKKDYPEVFIRLNSLEIKTSEYEDYTNFINYGV